TSTTESYNLSLHDALPIYDVAENVADHGLRHCRPISFPIALEIENPAENQQINEIGEIGKLHELGQRRMHQVFEPERRIHAGEPSVKGHEFCVLPPRIDQMHEAAQFFETKN